MTPKDSYVLIAYRADSADYCRGCHMASYASEFRGGFNLTRDELITKLAEVIYLNETGRINQSGFDFTILKNGRQLVDQIGMDNGTAFEPDEDYWDSPEYQGDQEDYNSIYTEAKRLTTVKLAEEKRAKEQAAVIAAQKQQDERRARDLQQLAALTAQYGSPTEPNL